MGFAGLLLLPFAPSIAALLYAKGFRRASILVLLSFLIGSMFVFRGFVMEHRHFGLPVATATQVSYVAGDLNVVANFTYATISLVALWGAAFALERFWPRRYVENRLMGYVSMSLFLVLLIALMASAGVWPFYDPIPVSI